MSKLSLETRYKKINYLWELILLSQHIMEQRNGMKVAVTMDKEAQVIDLIVMVNFMCQFGHWVPTLNNISRCACEDISG